MEAFIKSTFNISAQLKEELTGYVERRVIPSFSSGVNAAIEHYLKELRRAEYDKQMAAAAKDKAFLGRTLDCQAALDSLSGEVGGEW
jgi:metal-responsive CopG/Arc/MetJ family transcriptional regulator